MRVASRAAWLIVAAVMSLLLHACDSDGMLPEAGGRPSEVLVVGDSYKKDILPAESLGCRVAWLKGKGWTKEEDDQMHPSIISQLADVKKCLI